STLHLDVPRVRRAIESLITFGGRLKPPSAVQRTLANLRTSLSPLQSAFESASQTFLVIFQAAISTSKSLFEVLICATLCWLAILLIGAVVAWCIVSTSICAEVVNNIPTFLQQSFGGPKPPQCKSLCKAPSDSPSEA
ncbi:MAG: hypothetical protein ACTS4W_01045, partial [Candidatus Hodgkinia cicadicola]